MFLRENLHPQAFINLHLKLLQALEKQVQRVRTLFHRQLSIPLVDLEATLLTYKAWEVEQENVESFDLDKVYPHVAVAYKKANDILTARVHFEEGISRLDLPDAERLQNYQVQDNFDLNFI